jgi:hypothetical protein
MSRDDFFEQLAHDHYPGPRAVYDGPDGTARRAPRPSPRRVTRARDVQADRTRRGGRAQAAVALAGAALCAAAMTLVVIRDAEPKRDLVSARPMRPRTLVTRADVAGRRARSRQTDAFRARRTPPRDAQKSPPRRPRTRHRSPRPRSVRRVRRPTGTPRVAPAATPRPIPRAVATAPRAAPAPLGAATPSASAPASEPSCEFPPC